MSIYHLKNFQKFLELIEQDKIYICFNINEFLDNESVIRIKDRGTAFKLDNYYIEELFDLID